MYVAAIFISDPTKAPRHDFSIILPQLKLIYHEIFLHNFYKLTP